MSVYLDDAASSKPRQEVIDAVIDLLEGDYWYNPNSSYEDALKCRKIIEKSREIIAQKIKTNMIFVPSERGISHSPLEYTDIMDIKPGYILMKSYLKEKGWGK